MSAESSVIKRLKIAKQTLKMSSRACKIVETAIAEDKVIAFLKAQKYEHCGKASNGKLDDWANKKVWQFWGQGIENAPKIVKVCFKSVSQQLAHLDHIVLSRDTVHEYIDIPQYIQEKYKKRIISEAQFSDIVRLMLLSSYGGTWIDATVLLTKQPPEAFFSSPFFCFSAPTEDLLGGSRILGSSWFLHAIKGHPLVESAQSVMLNYWKENNDLIHYYLLHLIFSYLVETDCALREEWKKMPFYSSIPPHILQMQLLMPFDKNRFIDILEMSTVHKLTYYGMNGDSENSVMTFYDYLTTRFGESEHVI